MADQGIRFRLPGAESEIAHSRVHGPALRGAAAPVHELLAGVQVKQHYDLSTVARSVGTGVVTTPALAADEIVALEMDGGFVLYTSAARLADDLRRIDPVSARDGVFDLQALNRQAPKTRGLGDWVVRGLSVLGLEDALLPVDAASWAGTKAVMWAIEQKLEREPGLYGWTEPGASDADVLERIRTDLSNDRIDEPILVFVHGTASSTAGSFGALRRPDAEPEWLALRNRFGRHIYGFEHRTFSESPIDNALALATQLPDGARLSFVTHSRGGLVGDLICADALDHLVQAFRRPQANLREADSHDRKALRDLCKVLKKKSFRIERYLRVACPAQGTLLVSSHLDAFLSTLVHLIGLTGLAANPVYAVAKRIALQIAKNRTDPNLVPGIEALLPESPLAALVGRAAPARDARIGVIAGDIEGGGILKRIGVFLTDLVMFERENNDLVVDTESMFGGIARNDGRYVFDQGEDVSHFRYFANQRTRSLLQSWLTHDDEAEVRDFQPIVPQRRPIPIPRDASAVRGTRPVVFVLPGIMGSHLKNAANDRIWFDFLSLGHGRLREIALPSVMEPDGTFERFYGELCSHLTQSHEVVAHDYDWRMPLAASAHLLAQSLEQALKQTEKGGHPVRLLTHSMGGLVVRALIEGHRDLWDRLMQRQGAYWVMLGTPNRGSHGTVESLLALSGTMRKLALLDPDLGLQGVVELVAGFPGALQLLPKPGFLDAGRSNHDYYTDVFWRDFRAGNDSFWFGRSLGAVPEADLLREARDTWGKLEEELPNPDRIAYVAGYGRETPCGIERDEGGRRLRMIGTLAGDGTVTHASGLLEVLVRNQRVWYMDADHAGLTATEAHFPAITELLQDGRTLRLPQAPPALRGTEELFRYEPGPVLYPTEADLGRAAIGGRAPVRRQPRDRYTLSVCCRAMDLRYAVDPVLVGHYLGDAISGAEAQIDRHVVDNRLTLRHHLGLYAGELGTSVVVLDEPNRARSAAGIRPGAVVVGLGELGKLTLIDLGQTVRQGVLRYLMQLHDRAAERDPTATVGLTSVLIGYNSTTHISPADSVTTIIRALMEANRQFAETSRTGLRIERLEFVELYEDVAISAAAAVRDSVSRLKTEAERLGARLDAASELQCGDGMQRRLEARSTSFGYWPRMIVTAADRPQGRAADAARTEPAAALHFVLLSQRARAEAIEQQRQPGLVDSLVQGSIRSPQYRQDLSRALFHLLVPNDFKASARQTENLVLVVDAYTANLPWEMLVADEEPLVATTALVRQFETATFRQNVRSTQEKRAYVIGNPSTAGFYRAFPPAGVAAAIALASSTSTRTPVAYTPAGSKADALADLPGAEAEARSIAALLTGLGYQVTAAAPGANGVEVISGLYQKPYRIVHISAHGVYEAGEGAHRRTGVVLSEGQVLTAAEIGALEVVPDLVFLNCCHLGQMNDRQPRGSLETMAAMPYNRLAHSVARELIDCGVRAVIVAGWAVDDNAARRFAECFYDAFMKQRRPFGWAVHEARRAVLEEFRNLNTWGAFQAYGDPVFTLDPESRSAADGDFRPVAPQELVARIDYYRNELAHQRSNGDGTDAKLEQTVEGLLHKVPSAPWRQLPEVLYALGRLYADLGNFARASEYYQQAITVEDKRGIVPVVAIEQLANLEVREGARRMEAGDRDGEELAERGLQRLLALDRAAGGTAEGKAVNAERCALIGSAYKRRAKALARRIADGRDPSISALKDALIDSREWYKRGQGDPEQTGFSPYNALNRIALDAVFGSAGSKDTDLARKAGKRAAARYAASRDAFDLIMEAEGELYAALVDGSLATQHEDEGSRLVHALVGGYLERLDKLPQTARGRDSVVSQIELLATFIEALGADSRPAGRTALRLRSIAAALAPERGASARAERAGSGSGAAENRPWTGTRLQAEPEAAITGRRQTIESAPADGAQTASLAGMHERRALQSDSTEDLGEAIEHFERAVRENAEDLQSALDLAILLQRKGGESERDLRARLPAFRKLAARKTKESSAVDASDVAAAIVLEVLARNWRGASRYLGRLLELSPPSRKLDRLRDDLQEIERSLADAEQEKLRRLTARLPRLADTV